MAAHTKQFAVLTLGLLLAYAAPARAEQSINVRLVGGRVIIDRVTVRTKAQKITTTAVLGLTGGPIQLSPAAAQGLGFRSPEDVAGVKLDVSFRRGKFAQLKASLVTRAQDGALGRLTADYAPELKEMPATVILNISALAKAGLVLDLERKNVSLFSEEELRLAMDAPLTATHDRLRPSFILPMTKDTCEGAGLGGGAGRVGFSLEHADTLVTKKQVNLAELVGDAPGVLSVGTVDIGELTAMRFADMGKTEGMLGTNALRHLRVTFDKKGSRVRIDHTSNPRNPKIIVAERKYFLALVKDDADGMEAFLTANPQTRLGEEAAFTTAILRIEAEPCLYDPCERAIRLIAKHAREERCCRYLNMVSDYLSKDDVEIPRKDELVMLTLKLALATAHKDLEGTAAHNVHMRLGKLALKADDIPMARRHILSAAFGMPKHPETNYLLGTVYLKMDRPLRAWSRFAQCIVAMGIERDIPPESFGAFDQLSNDPKFRAEFTALDAQQMLDGRVHEAFEFHPADRHADKATAQVPHVRLVEMFTKTPDLRTTIAELAFGGVADYFEGTDTAFIVYGLERGRGGDPLATDVSKARARFYGVRRGATIIYDGARRLVRSKVPNRRDVLGDIEKLVPEFYKELREAAVLEKPEPTLWTITGAAVRDGATVRANVEVAGPADAGNVRLHLVLCERAVLAQCYNLILSHRYVARQGLSPADGLPVATAEDRKRSVEVDTVALSEALATRLATPKTDPPLQPKPTYVDAGACIVVAILQDSETKKVVAARMLAVPQPPEAGEGND